MLPVVMTIVLVAMIAFGLNYESAGEADRTGRELDIDTARYVAEAGLNNALWQVEQAGCTIPADMNGIPLGAHSYTTTLASDLTVTNGYTLAADQDAWIRSDDTSKNNGGTMDLHIRYEGGKIERPLVRFDLASLPANAEVLSATAWFYIETGKEHPEGGIELYRIVDDWTEAGVTWDSMNDKYDDQILTSIPPQPKDEVWVSANLTAQVQAWVNGEPNYGIMLDSTGEGVHGEYVSREGPLAQRPYLHVVVGARQTAAAGITSIGTLANGTEYTLERLDVIHPQMPPSQVVLRPDGAVGIDGGVRNAQPTANYGAAEEIQVSGGLNPEHMLLKFDLHSVPPGARIVSAELALSLNWMTSADAEGIFTVYPMLEQWREGTGDNWDSGDGANWNTPYGIGNWSWPENHHTAEIVASIPVNPGFTGWHLWNVGHLVQRWVDGGLSNHGLLVTGNDQVGDAYFRTSDNADAATHPQLTITYSCDCGTPCLAPRSAGKILMVVGDLFALTEREKRIYTRLKDWGYTVRLIDDDSPSLVLDLAVELNDVVLISGSAEPASVGSKLTDTTKGIVSELQALTDELGISSNSDSPIGTHADLVDTDHLITRIFPSGPLLLKERPTAMATATGSLSADARVLMRSGGDAALIALEAGSTLEGGGTAAGRRVLLPYGSGEGDPHLAPAGWLLLQRTLDWAMSNSAPVLVGHWMLDDGSGLTALDSSGRGNDGTLMGGPSWTSGKLAGALSLDGSNDRVLVPDAASLDITGTITLAAWVRPNKTGTQYVIRKAQYDNEDGYELSLSNSGKVFFRLNQNTEGNTYRIDSTTSYPDDGRWMHIAASYDGMTQRLYIDGVEEVAQAASISINANDLDLSLGGQVDGTRVVDGIIDDVRLYSGALSAEVIEDLAAENCSGTFLDGFGALSFGNNDGTLTWTGDWLEIGESDGPASGDVRIRDDNGPYQLWLRDNNNGGEGVEREADLSGAVSAKLSFEYRRSGLDSASDYVALEISSSGADGPWVELTRFQGSATDAAYQTFNQDISAYISETTRIRLVTSPTMGNKDTVIFDNIQIECSP